jgi:hypothetical protein
MSREMDEAVASATADHAEAMDAMAGYVGEVEGTVTEKERQLVETKVQYEQELQQQALDFEKRLKVERTQREALSAGLVALYATGGCAGAGGGGGGGGGGGSARGRGGYMGPQARQAVAAGRHSGLHLARHAYPGGFADGFGLGPGRVVVDGEAAGAQKCKFGDGRVDSDTDGGGDGASSAWSGSEGAGARGNGDEDEEEDEDDSTDAEDGASGGGASGGGGGGGGGDARGTTARRERRKRRRRRLARRRRRRAAMAARDSHVQLAMVWGDPAERKERGLATLAMDVEQVGARSSGARRQRGDRGATACWQRAALARVARLHALHSCRARCGTIGVAALSQRCTARAQVCDWLDGAGLGLYTAALEREEVRCGACACHE